MAFRSALIVAFRSFEHEFVRTACLDRQHGEVPLVQAERHILSAGTDRFDLLSGGRFDGVGAVDRGVKFDRGERDQRLSATHLGGMFTVTCHPLGPPKVAGPLHRAAI